MRRLVNGSLVLAVSLELAGLPVHQAGPGAGLLPAVVVFDQLSDGLVGQHLPDAVKRLPVELEGLLEQHLVLDAPLVRERGEVGEVLQSIVGLGFFLSFC